MSDEGVDKAAFAALDEALRAKAAECESLRGSLQRAIRSLGDAHDLNRDVIDRLKSERDEALDGSHRLAIALGRWQIAARFAGKRAHQLRLWLDGATERRSEAVSESRRLRDDVERLTKERDEARGEVVALTDEALRERGRADDLAEKLEAALSRDLASAHEKGVYARRMQEAQRRRDDVRDHARAAAHFLANGRWGTCAECGGGDPTKCKYTQRYDHNLGLAELCDMLKRYAPTKART